MTLKKCFAFCMLVLCQFILAQQDSIVKLEEVVIPDSQLKKYSNSQSVLILNDSVITNNKASLTSFLNYNSVIYFKENGLGMVSSPSFRGTTAAQTAVIWNGININSQLNGQTDFNTLSAQNFNSVAIRSGGGSAIYGSSAIGGSVHLQSNLNYTKRFENILRLDYGSFNTLGLNYNMQVAQNDISAQISFSRNSSDNDYPYLNTNKKNENGQFYNSTFNVNMGLKLDIKNSLQFYSFLFEGDRHFSGTLAAPSKSKYVDLNTRNLIEWIGTYHQFISKFKTAYFTEKYKYFENASTSIFSYGEAKTVIAKYDLTYTFINKIELNSVLDYNKTKGDGSDIGSNDRQIGSVALLMKHKLYSKFLYELVLRKEISDVYKSPILFSIGTNYKPFTFYQLKLNGSRNYKIPTFNDLYWLGSGNSDLVPESSYQAEIGNAFEFQNFKFSITNYYINIQNLIQWAPGLDGNWSPNNIGKVATYGAEVLLNYSKKMGRNQFDINCTYAYTVSEDEVKKKQLIYVPYHKFTSALAYSIADFSMFYQFLYTGEVYTSSDNYYSLDDYWVSNIGVNYHIGKKNRMQLGVKMYNVFDMNYQSVSIRPMPGRNYTINLIFNF